jgi:hypothetical protein
VQKYTGQWNIGGIGEPKPVWCGAMVSIVGDEDKMEVLPVVNKAGKKVTSCVQAGIAVR